MLFFERLFCRRAAADREAIYLLVMEIRKMSTATDRLTASTNALNSTVQLAITALSQGGDDAPINAASDVLDQANIALQRALPPAPAAPAA